MPELPEVETVIRTLEKQLKDLSIKEVIINYPFIIDNVDVETFKSGLVNNSFKEFKRIGKYLIFIMDNKILVAHLRMEGKFYLLNTMKDYNKHVHIKFLLSNGMSLQFNDVRKFAKMYLYDKCDDLMKLDCFKNVGIDALDDRLTSEYIKSYIHKKNVPLKTFLMDQKCIAGIGNIYADEICYKMKLHPLTKVSKLNDKDIDDLLKFIRIVMRGAIKAGGTTIRSYTSSLGITGRFQLELKVHQRENEKCYECGSTIKKIKVGGRGTCYCETCQKLR